LTALEPIIRRQLEQDRSTDTHPSNLHATLPTAFHPHRPPPVRAARLPHPAAVHAAAGAAGRVAESTRSRGEVLAAVDALDAGLTIKELRCRRSGVELLLDWLQSFPGVSCQQSLAGRRRRRGRLGLGRPG